MSEKTTQIDLNTFADGALAERLNEEIQKVIENIANPNTDPKKARKVGLTLTFKPSGNRGIATVAIDAKSTILQSIPVETEMLLNYSNEGVVGVELKSGIPGQAFFDGQDVRTDTGEIIPAEDNAANDKVVKFK